jgi:hypothetical protein
MELEQETPQRWVERAFAVAHTARMLLQVLRDLVAVLRPGHGALEHERAGQEMGAQDRKALLSTPCAG